MARPLKQVFTCPVCKDEFTRDAWPFVNTRYKGQIVPRPAYTCKPCQMDYHRSAPYHRRRQLFGRVN